MLALLTAAVVLTPVAADDPLLRDPATFVSDAAQRAISAEAPADVKCLDTSSAKDAPKSVCLSDAEWHVVFERVAHNRSADQRDRAIWLSRLNAAR